LESVETADKDRDREECALYIESNEAAMVSFSGMFTMQRRSVSQSLLDRAGLAKLAHQEMQRAERTGGPLALMLVEIDEFERLRAAGSVDRVLEGLAGVLMDVCGAGSAVARMRSQEFAVLLPGRSTEELSELAEQVRARTPEMVANQDGGAVTVSVGVGMHYSGGNNWVQMLSRADVALFCAKSGGSNRVVMDSGSARRVEERRVGMLQTAA